VQTLHKVYRQYSRYPHLARHLIGIGRCKGTWIPDWHFRYSEYQGFFWRTSKRNAGQFRLRVSVRVDRRALTRDSPLTCPRLSSVHPRVMAKAASSRGNEGEVSSTQVSDLYCRQVSGRLGRNPPIAYRSKCRCLVSISIFWPLLLHPLFSPLSSSCDNFSVRILLKYLSYKI
jgi:hypothetical protein